MPTFDVGSSDVEGFMDELQAFQSAFHDWFPRSESRVHCFDYMVGQCRPLERQSIEPMALHVEGGTIRGMPRCSRDGVWEEEQMGWNFHQLVADERGAPDGVLMFDETGCVKKGHDSVGVARPYCGTLGKVDHCQGGGCAAQASRHGDALLEKRVCLPEGWCPAASAVRRAKGHVPDALRWQSNPPLAAAMLQAIAHEGLLPCKSGVAAGLYGQSPDCLDAVDTGVGVTTFVALPADTRCGLQAPRTTEQTQREKGEGRAKRVVVAPDTLPCTVAAVAACLPASRWSRRQVSEGTKGPIVEALARQRVTRCQEGLPERTVWRVLNRPVGGGPTSSYSIRHAPISPPWRPFVW